MKRFKNILVVCNATVGSSNVIKHAANLASQNNARLTLVDVMSPRYSTRAEQDERAKFLKMLVPSLACKEIGPIFTTVLVGTGFLEIIKLVLREDHDLVIACSDDGGLVDSLRFSGTGIHLMRKCPCPVWIIKPQQEKSYSRILACIDPASENSSQLDKTILELASSMAITNNAHLDITHAWDVEGEDRDTLASEIQDYTRRDILKKHHDIHNDRVQNLVDSLQIKPEKLQIHTPQELAQRAIINHVSNHDIDLTIMGTISRTGITGFFIGNTAETVLSSITSSVFTVKPDGFVSPVSLS